MNSVNVYAEIRYGKVYEIYQSHLPLSEFISLFPLTNRFIDITGRKDVNGNDIEIGSLYDNMDFYPNQNFNPESIEDHRKIAQERRLNIVKEHIISGFNVTLNDVTYHYNSEEVDQDNIRTYYQASLIDPNLSFSIRVKRIDNGELVEIVHDKDMIAKVCVAMANHIQECKRVSWRMDNDIKNALNIEEVYNVLTWQKF